MKLASTTLVTIVGLLHIGFMILESFLWTKPTGLKIFRMTPEVAEITRALALNQGLYNGFLAAGLFWAAWSGDFKLKIFFLSCVLIAGVVGALTASKTILYVQALPGLVALILVLFAARS